MPDYSLEQELEGRVAGIDEAGRGPWAGPVIAAAVIIGADAPAELIAGIDDSKKLSPARRDALFDALGASAEIGVGRADVAEIDDLNILKATHLAMRRALTALPAPADHALVDGNSDPGLPCPSRLVVKGDARSLSIAAASVVAKVSRDREMAALAEAFPGYGLEKHKGYGTAQHAEALAKLGPTPVHRRSFAPVRRLLENGAA